MDFLKEELGQLPGCPVRALGPREADEKDAVQSPDAGPCADVECSLSERAL